ncbi:hypothetical protein [Roseiflexus sp.]|uniref:hypothetical protein n=1 Tax=Roseiflexus sp. TaxID=2562120 RepID=UPI00398B237F
MPTARPDRDEAFKRAGLTALIEAADALPGIGPLLANLGAFYQELRRLPRDLHTEVRDVVQAMAGDFRTFLQREAPHHAEQTVAVALTEALDILAAYGLTDEALVREAGLDAAQAARLTLDRAADRLRSLETRTEALVRRLVEAYYRTYLDHREALRRVGAPALEALLARTVGLERRLRVLADLLRTRGGATTGGGSVRGSVLITGSQNVVIIEQAAAQARIARRDPTQMLRVAAQHHENGWR